MGHVRLDSLPSTRKWREVLELIRGEGDPRAVVRATMEATAQELMMAGEDASVVHTVWLIAQLPQAAQQPDFVEALKGVGVEVRTSPTLVELASAVGLAVRLQGEVANPLPTDLAEMARLSAVETIVVTLNERVPGLLAKEPGAIQAEVGRLAAPNEFGALSREFFGRLLERALTFFVSRELPLHVGPGKRFQTVAELEAFSNALAQQVHQAAGIVESFAGNWYSKAHTEGALTPKHASSLVTYAMKRVRSEISFGGQ